MHLYNKVNIFVEDIFHSSVCNKIQQSPKCTNQKKYPPKNWNGRKLERKKMKDPTLRVTMS